jgi:multidrug efflux pump subunit AcrA (membrane-fusion protein)
VIQDEVRSRTFDLAARVDGRIAQVVVTRSQDVEQGAPLIRIDNPVVIAKERQSEAALRVADATGLVSGRPVVLIVVIRRRVIRRLGICCAEAN